MTTNTTHHTDDQSQAFPAAAVRIPAREITLTDLVDEDGLLYAVTSIRLQGANPAEVVLEIEGHAGRRHYRTTAVLTVRRQAA